MVTQVRGQNSLLCIDEGKDEVRRSSDRGRHIYAGVFPQSQSIDPADGPNSMKRSEID